MTIYSDSRMARPFLIATAALLTLTPDLAAGDKPRQTIPDPGFLPVDYCKPAFTETLDTATIAVLPTIIRRADRTAHSFDSQEQIVIYLNEMGMAAEPKPRRVDMGAAPRRSQWKTFESGAKTVGNALEDYDTGADYTLVMELLVPDPQSVFGIEVYMLDRECQHVLSFLLNDHHRMFAEAGLVAKNTSEEARSTMIEKATAVGLAALDQQLRLLRADDDPS